MKRNNLHNYYTAHRLSHDILYLLKGYAPWITGTYVKYYGKETHYLIDMVTIDNAKLLRIIFEI
jgi:hypothetical protein